MANVRKAAGEGNVRARPRAREKQEEERVLLPHSSRVLHASHAPKISFSRLPFGTPDTQARLSLEQLKNGMFLFVTLRFLSNLCITLIASLFYFLHVSLVCFNVSCINKLKLSIIVSIKDSVLQYVQIFSIIFLNKQD